MRTGSQLTLFLIIGLVPWDLWCTISNAMFAIEIIPNNQANRKSRLADASPNKRLKNRLVFQKNLRHASLSSTRRRAASTKGE